VQQLQNLAPSNPNTQRAVREFNAACLRKAREAMNAKNNAEADRWVAEARAGGVSAAEIASFQRDMVNARQKAAAQETERLAQNARDRIRDGRLTDPANDSANYYLTQLQTSDPTNPAFAQMSHDLSNKLIERARASAAAGKTAQVDPDLTLARHWGADPKDIAQVQALSQSRIPQPTTGGNRGGSAAAAAAASGMTPAQLAQNLKRTKYTPPEFPAKALAQRISGTVTVEYVVDTCGTPRDVRVVEATPPGVFDKAATSAVKHWHYEPVIANGAPVEVPVRTAIRFELPSQ